MVEVARTDDNMIPPMLDAVRAEATLGEICDVAARGVGRVPRARPVLRSRPGDSGVTPYDSWKNAART